MTYEYISDVFMYILRWMGKNDLLPFGHLPTGQLRITACDSQRQVESSYRFSRQLGQARHGDGMALL